MSSLSHSRTVIEKNTEERMSLRRIPARSVNRIDAFSRINRKKNREVNRRTSQEGAPTALR